MILKQFGFDLKKTETDWKREWNWIGFQKGNVFLKETEIDFKVSKTFKGMD